MKFLLLIVAEMDTRSFSELTSELQASVDDLVLLAKGFENERDVLSDFAPLLQKFSPILSDLRDRCNVDDGSVPVRKAMESLEREFHRAETLIKNPNSRGFVKQIEDLTHDLGRSLGLVLFASLDLPNDTKHIIGSLHKELMGANFGTSQLTTASPSTASRFSSEIEIEEEIEMEIIEEERISLDKDDVVLQIKYGNDDELKLAIFELQDLVSCKKVTDEWISDQTVVSVLVNRLSSCKTNTRLSLIQMLRILASENVLHKVSDAFFE